MAKRGHSEEAILRVLRAVESGETVVAICRKQWISQQTFYLWKKKYAGLGLSELRELGQLREENGKLKRPSPNSAAIPAGSSGIPWLCSSIGSRLRTVLPSCDFALTKS